jgi:glycerol uptake facilitator-like aquaporin
MATIRLIFAFVGLAILFAVIMAAIRSRDSDRLGEGLLIGIYVGALGSISLLVILMHLGLL